MPRSDSLTDVRPRHAVPVPGQRPRPVAAGAAGLLFATAPAAEGGPAAALPLGGTTLVGRLLEQLRGLGLRTIWVVTRPEWREPLEAVARADGVDVRVRASVDLVADLLIAAEVAGEAPGTLLVARADVLTHREALAGLLADSRIVSGVLAGPPAAAPGWGAQARAARRRIVSAGSPFHRVRNANLAFLGFLKVDARDREPLAAAARRLAELAADRPEAWERELDRKAAEWQLERTEGEDAVLLHRVAAQDAVSLLLVGLVRGGADLASSRLRGFSCLRPASAPEARRGLAELEAVDEDRVALDAAVKALDGFFTTFFVSPYSRHLARFCARRGWTPNRITLASTAVGVLAALAFALGTRAGMLAGAVLLQAAFTLDCVDGQLARYTRTFSRLGAWLDSISDRAKEYLVFAGLAVGASRGFDQDVWVLAAAALALQTARHTLDFSFAVRQRQAVEALPLRPLEEPDDTEPGATATAAPAPAQRRPFVRAARHVGRGLGRLERTPWGRWGKRIVLLPIGERFALISVTAALFTPRITFVALLACGGFAACYALAVRIPRSLAHRVRAPHRSGTPAMRVYRDDGPLAAAIGRAARGLRLDETAVALLGALVLGVASALAPDPLSLGALTGAAALAVLLVASGSRRPHDGRLAWLVPPLLRMLEYAFLVRLTVAADRDALPLCFALLGVLAFHHYDTVYRLRHQRLAPPAWLQAAAGGWDGRVLVACVLALAGVLGPGLLVAAAGLGVLFVTESALSWVRRARAERPAALDDEDDEVPDA